VKSRITLSFTPRLQRVMLSVALVPLVTYVTLIAGLPFLSGFYYPGRVRAQLLGALLLGGWLVWRWLRGREFVQTGLDLPFCAVIAVTAVSAVLSVDPRRSVEGVLDGATYVLVFYALLDLRSHERLWSGLLNAVLIVAGIVCLLAFVQLLWWYGDQPPAVEENLGLMLRGEIPLPRLSVLGNPNTLAVYLLLVLPLGVQRWLGAKLTLARWLLVAGLMAGALVLALTGSRGGLLGLGAACAGWGILLLARRGRGRLTAWQVALAGAAAVVVAGLVVSGRGGLLLSGRNAQVRWESWRLAAQVLVARPLFGSGPGTFGYEILRHWASLSFIDAQSHAHSIYVTIAADIGGLGVVAVLWLAASFIAGLRARAAAPSGFTVRAACALGLLGWAAHGLVDTFLDVPAILTTVLLLAAGALPRQVPASGRGAQVRLVAATVAFVFLCGAGVWIDYGFAAHHAGREAAMIGDWKGVASLVDTAVERDPAFRLYSQEAAFSHGVLACGDPSYVEGAIARYHALPESWPDWSLDHANLAALLARAGDIDGGVREGERARELHPSEPVYACQLGELLEQAGRLDEAIESYADCVARQPPWLTSSFWEGTPWRAGARSEIVARAESTALASGGLVARASLRNYAGLFEEALADVSDYQKDGPESSRAQFEQARALAGLGRDDEAHALLDCLLDRNPLDAPSLMLRGQIRLRQGDAAGATYDIENGAALAAGPGSLYWQGRLAEALGETIEAIARYEAAVGEATKPETTLLAPSLAGRLPLPVERLPCLTVLRPREAFLAPALRLARLLEQTGRAGEAAEIYRTILSQEPYSTEALERLEELGRNAGDG
jgi:putative inorganic carbon (HCO3(-)) transporter